MDACPVCTMATSSVPPSAPLRRVAVRELLAGATEIILVHDGQDYRLRVTRAGKLILTK